jgi:hypothetical protein
MIIKSFIGSGKAALGRCFSGGRKFVKAAEVESDPELKKYFDARLEKWTRDYYSVREE